MKFNSLLLNALYPTKFLNYKTQQPVIERFVSHVIFKLEYFIVLCRLMIKSFLKVIFSNR